MCNTQPHTSTYTSYKRLALSFLNVFYEDFIIFYDDYLDFFVVALHPVRRQLHQSFHTQPSGPDALLSGLGLPELADRAAACPHPSGPHRDGPESRFRLYLLAATDKGTTLSGVRLHGFLHLSEVYCSNVWFF